MKKKIEYYLRLESEEKRVRVSGFANVDGGENTPLNVEDIKSLALTLLEMVRLWNAGTDEVIKEE